MRKEYLSQLKNVLKLRRENSDVKIPFKLSIESIKNIGLSLTADHIVHNNFSGIAETRLAKLKSIENYEHSSLDKVNRDFSSQSNKLKPIWNQYLKIKSYLANLKIFNGLEEKIKENEQKYHAAKSIEEVKEYHKITIELLNEKKNLDRIWNQHLIIKNYLANLKIFNGLEEKVKENEQKDHTAKSIEEVKEYHKITIELFNEIINLDRICNQHLEIKDYLGLEIKDYLGIFNGLEEKVKENEQKYHTAKSIEEVKEYHKITTELLNERPNLDRIGNDLGYIRCRINECRKFFKNNSFFKEYYNKWAISIEKDCANAKDSIQIENLKTQIKFRKKILGAISKISSDWLKMRENLSQIYTSSSAPEHELFDKDRINIINKLSSLENQSKLDYENAVKIHNQLKRKINSWMKINTKPYPIFGFFPFRRHDDFSFREYDSEGGIVNNIILFFVNILIFPIFFIWPFTYVTKGVTRYKRYKIMKKPVLDWSLLSHKLAIKKA